MSGGTTTVFTFNYLVVGLILYKTSQKINVNILKYYLTTETCLNIVHDSKIWITFERFFLM